MNERQTHPVSSVYDDSERDSFSTRLELEAIVDILKTRFSDYSNEAPSLTFLSPTLDFETLREILKLAGRASTFSEFCDKLDALRNSRNVQTQEVDEELQKELATAQLFNNFVVKILENRRRIGASFLRRHVDEISSKVAQELDFESYSTEPTVHIFGAQVSRLCDLIFTIPFKDRSQGSLAVAVPMEHKSTQTRNVVLQLLTSLVLVLQYILRHKERFQRKDKKFVWPFLLLFYTGVRPWKKALNFPDLFATPDPALDKRWIFKLRFKFVKLFARLKRRKFQDDPWLLAFLRLTKAAEKIVAKKDATSEDWKKAWNDALRILEGKIDPADEEQKDIFEDFYIFVSKVAIRQGWKAPTREEITCNLENLGGVDMTYKFDTLFELAVLQAKEELEPKLKQEIRRKIEQEVKQKVEQEVKQKVEQEVKQKVEQEVKQKVEQQGEQKGVRNMLKKCINVRFPRMPQTMLNSILAITDVNILETIFSVACVSDSLDNFQRDIRGIAPIV